MRSAQVFHGKRRVFCTGTTGARLLPQAGGNVRMTGGGGALIARVRSAARLAGPGPVGAWLWSSPKVASRTQAAGAGKTERPEELWNASGLSVWSWCAVRDSNPEPAD